jgi:N-acetylmuramoyl-L-alanine amidase
MVKKIFITLVLFLFTQKYSFADIDVVYPSSTNVTINANSVFFIGNTDSNASFSINSQPVKLWNNNFFVQTIPLQYGNNKIILKSTKNGVTTEKIYNINRNKISNNATRKDLQFIKHKNDEFLYTKVIKNNATIRENPSSSAKRVIDLQGTNIVLYLEGQKGDYYKIEENGSSEFWIHKTNIEEPVSVKKRMNAKLKKHKHYSDDLYDYYKFYLSHPVLYSLENVDKKVKLTMYGVEQNNQQGNFVYNFDFSTPLLGYDCYYEDNNLIFKKAKLPKNINKTKPLQNLNIFVDAGHGGIEKGALGPTRVQEKDINLAIANYLAEDLKNNGANVITSRTTDKQVGLYDRVDIAKKNNALISISIHNNSLPDGKDPYSQHGTEVHYYNENAKFLANLININLSNDLKLYNNGIHKSSFALNRSTDPVSVLVEVAYMINPEEYMRLQKTQFQKDVAKSITKSIEQYILLLKQEKM